MRHRRHWVVSSIMCHCGSFIKVTKMNSKTSLVIRVEILICTIFWLNLPRWNHGRKSPKILELLCPKFLNIMQSVWMPSADIAPGHAEYWNTYTWETHPLQFCMAMKVAMVSAANFLVVLLVAMESASLAFASPASASPASVSIYNYNTDDEPMFLKCGNFNEKMVQYGERFEWGFTPGNTNWTCTFTWGRSWQIQNAVVWANRHQRSTVPFKPVDHIIWRVRTDGLCQSISQTGPYDRRARCVYRWGNQTRPWWSFLAALCNIETLSFPDTKRESSVTCLPLQKEFHIFHSKWLWNCTQARW